MIPLFSSIYTTSAEIYSNIFGRLFHLIAGKFTLTCMGALIIINRGQNRNSITMKLCMVLLLFYITYSLLQGSKAGILWSTLMFSWSGWLSSKERGPGFSISRIKKYQLIKWVKYLIYGAILITIFGLVVSQIREEFSSIELFLESLFMIDFMAKLRFRIHLRLNC